MRSEAELLYDLSAYAPLLAVGGDSQLVFEVVTT